MIRRSETGYLAKLVPRPAALPQQSCNQPSRAGDQHRNEWLGPHCSLKAIFPPPCLGAAMVERSFGCSADFLALFLNGRGDVPGHLLHTVSRISNSVPGGMHG